MGVEIKYFVLDKVFNKLIVKKFFNKWCFDFIFYFVWCGLK